MPDYPTCATCGARLEPIPGRRGLRCPTPLLHPGHLPHKPSIEEEGTEYRFRCACGVKSSWRASKAEAEADQQRHWERGARW